MLRLDAVEDGKLCRRTFNTQVPTLTQSPTIRNRNSWLGADTTENALAASPRHAAPPWHPTASRHVHRSPPSTIMIRKDPPSLPSTPPLHEVAHILCDGSYETFQMIGKSALNGECRSVSAQPLVTMHSHLSIRFPSLTSQVITCSG